MITDACGERTFPSASPIAHYSVGVENGISKSITLMCMCFFWGQRLLLSWGFEIGVVRDGKVKKYPRPREKKSGEFERPISN